MNRSRIRFGFALLVVLGALLPACVSVQPYERGDLARQDMQFGGSSAIHGAEAHATEVREGAAGGFDAAGGGCGCN